MSVFQGCHQKTLHLMAAFFRVETRWLLAIDSHRDFDLVTMFQ